MGIGTAVSAVTALGHYERSVVAGNAEAQARLGLLLVIGAPDVAVDPARGRRLIDSAFAAEDAWGIAGMAYLHEKGVAGALRDLARALGALPAGRRPATRHLRRQRRARAAPAVTPASRLTLTAPLPGQCAAMHAAAPARFLAAAQAPAGLRARLCAVATRWVVLA